MYDRFITLSVPQQYYMFFLAIRECIDLINLPVLESRRNTHDRRDDKSRVC